MIWWILLPAHLFGFILFHFIICVNSSWLQTSPTTYWLISTWVRCELVRLITSNHRLAYRQRYPDAPPDMHHSNWHTVATRCRATVSLSSAKIQRCSYTRQRSKIFCWQTLKTPNTARLHRPLSKVQKWMPNIPFWHTSANDTYCYLGSTANWVQMLALHSIIWNLSKRIWVNWAISIPVWKSYSTATLGSLKREPHATWHGMEFLTKINQQIGTNLCWAIFALLCLGKKKC